MLSVDILRHIPMSDGVQVVGRLDVNMANYVAIPIAQVLGQSTTDAVSQKLLTDTVEDISNEIVSLGSELEKIVKQSDLEFGSSYIPYYEGGD